MVTPQPRTDILKLIQHLKAHGSAGAPPVKRGTQTVFANMYNIPLEDLYAGIWSGWTILLLRT